MKRPKVTVEIGLIVALGGFAWMNHASSAGSQEAELEFTARVEDRSPRKASVMQEHSSVELKFSKHDTPEFVLEKLLAEHDIKIAAELLRDWTHEDPAAALAWFEHQKTDGFLISHGLTNTWQESPLLGGLIAGLVPHDRAKAWQLFRESQGDGRFSAQAALTSALVGSGAKAHQVWQEFSQTKPGDGASRQLLRDLSAALIRHDRDSELTAFLKEQKLPPRTLREITLASLNEFSPQRSRQLIATLLPPAEQGKAMEELQRRLSHLKL